MGGGCQEDNEGPGADTAIGLTAGLDESERIVLDAGLHDVEKGRSGGARPSAGSRSKKDAGGGAKKKGKKRQNSNGTRSGGRDGERTT